MMGRIDASFEKANVGTDNVQDQTLGGVSLVCVGDPA